MSTLELNKIVGAILLAGIVAVVSGILADRLVQPKPVEHAAAVPDADTGGEAAAGAAATDEAAEEPPAEGETSPAGVSIAALLAAADPARGETVAKKCAACHSFEQGGANKIGPNLWDIVGRQPGVHEGYAFSDAIKGLGKPWGYEELDAFLATPKAFAPGTKMTFPGLRKPEDRADAIAYLRTLSGDPKPLP
ncbi:MAG: cytochrome c family protein [Dongiaceae bacterium]